MSSLLPRHRYTFRDYLDVEEMSAVKHEFLDGEIYAMAGGTPEHAALCAALIARLVALVHGGPRRVYTSDLRVRVRATGLATYPDAGVICGALARDPDSPTHVLNPAALFEVLSPSTEDYDRGEKREHCQQIESLREYVTLRQDARRVEVWRRTSGSGWSHESYAAGQSFELTSIGSSVAVDELYAEAGLSVP
jgi:Uma2 family endonuclease